jgi:hypothetical protein
MVASTKKRTSKSDFSTKLFVIQIGKLFILLEDSKRFRAFVCTFGNYKGDLNNS